MAQQIISNTVTGLFNAGKVDLQSATDDVMYADLKDCKDEIVLIVNIPFTATGKYLVEFLPADENAGDKGVKSELNSKSSNIIFFTTKGIKASDGNGYFKISNSNGSSINSDNIEIAVIKHTPVVNH